MAHFRRVLAAIIVPVVPIMVGWISADDREELTNHLIDDVLSKSLSDADSGSRDDGREDTGSDTRSVDVEYVWRRLLYAERVAWRLYRLITDKHLGLDLSDAGVDADRLARKVGDLYGLVCDANRTQAPMNPGDTPAVITTAINRVRGAAVDAELPPAPTPAPDAPTWTIRYHPHGGYAATLTAGRSDTGPHRGWGYAPTPRSAAATVAGFTPHHSPTIVLSPQPPVPVHLVDPSTDSDLSTHGQYVRDLLEERGTIYDQHLHACEDAARLLRARGVDEYLAERVALLNATEPQLEHAQIVCEDQDPANHDHKGSFNTTLWVPTRLVAATDHPTWGDFSGHRQDMLRQITQGLADATDLHAFTARLFTDEINLLHTPAWAGPIYRVGLNGNHRVHTARLLNLPWLAVTVIHAKPPPAWQSWSMASVESRWAQTHWNEKWSHRRHALIEGLIRRGIIDAEFDDNPNLFSRTVHCTRLPAPWLVRAPELAASANAFYENLYPGALATLGIPQHIGTDASAWTRWLTSDAH
ncbi:hypothetical protein [Alloactinosynnema sp. L-07]|uniref:hypothetical protein n=1 Tax=Alloactinosynnema sp. L-07 TaxID=1653480 RepID=UPI0006B4A8E9|nr:hypothetical protein [Alloactinosynnema sp. L-07]